MLETDRRAGSWSQEMLEQCIPRVEVVGRALAHLTERSDAPLPACDERPIFVFALGWGSGSTMIQRILMTDPRVLLWGEPYGRMGLISALTAGLGMAADGWPLSKHIKPRTPEEHVSEFVANYFPPPQHLLEAARSLVYQWCGSSARQRGYERWGLKEVRLSGADALVLAHLFPQARFLAVVRDPRDCFRSAMNMPMRWRPDLQLNTPQRFAAFWNRLAQSWRDLPQHVPHRMIRYEDILNGRTDFRELERFLDLKLDEGRALSVWAGKRGSRNELSDADRDLIAEITAPMMQGLGYDVQQTC